jgi:type II secretory pathway component PulC
VNINGLQEITTEQQQALAKWLAALIVISTMIVLIASARTTLATLKQQPAPVLEPKVTANTSVDISVAHSLFGLAEQAQNLPSTQLELTLRGAFTAVDPKHASAIIEINGQAKNYRTGQTITGNTTLHSVHSDRVILARNSELETLYFPELVSPVIATRTTDSAATTTTSNNNEAQIKRRLEELRARIRKNKGA